MKFRNKLQKIKQKIAHKLDIVDELAFGILVSSAIYLIVIKQAVRGHKCKSD